MAWGFTIKSGTKRSPNPQEILPLRILPRDPTEVPREKEGIEGCWGELEMGRGQGRSYRPKTAGGESHRP